MKYSHYVSGGGLGDLWRECWRHNALGILKRWKLLHRQDSLRVVLMSHNPSSRQLLDYQPWIDEVIQVPFPTDTEKSWEVFYERYPELLAGKELRFHVQDRRSTYSEEFDPLRTPHGEVEWIASNTMRMDLPKMEFPTVDFVFHLGAGAQMRAIDTSFLDEMRAEFRNTTTLEVGASFQREGHGQEQGAQLHPLSLASTLMHAKGVIGSESAVTYIAAMMGIPTVVLYREDQTFDLVQRGLSQWSWYWGVGEEGNLYLKWPLSEEDLGKVAEWVRRLR